MSIFLPLVFGLIFSESILASPSERPFQTNGIEFWSFDAQQETGFFSSIPPELVTISAGIPPKLTSDHGFWFLEPGEITVPIPPDFLHSSEFSVSFWLETPQELNSAPFLNLVASNPSKTIWQAYLTPQTGQLSFRIQGTVYHSHIAAPQDRVFFTLSFRPNLLEIYRNQTLVDSIRTHFSIPIDSWINSSLVIGRDPFDSLFWNGTIGKVQITNQFLSPEEFYYLSIPFTPAQLYKDEPDYTENIRESSTTKSVVEISLSLPNHEVDKFRRSGSDCPSSWEPISKIAVNGKVYTDAQIQLVRPCSSESWGRPSIAIDLKTSGNQGDHNFLQLYRGTEDPSLLRSCVGLDFFRNAGMIAPRCSYANLSINDEFFGTYIRIEPVVDAISRAMPREFHNDIEVLDSSALGEILATTLKTDSQAPKSPKHQLTLIDKQLDIDQFIKYWAIEQVIGFRDGFSLSASNIAFFRNPLTQKIQIVPTRMGSILQGIDPGLYQNADLNAVLYQDKYFCRKLTSQIKEFANYLWDETQLFTNIVDRSRELDRFVFDPAQYQLAQAGLAHLIVRLLRRDEFFNQTGLLINQASPTVCRFENCQDQIVYSPPTIGLDAISTELKPHPLFPNLTAQIDHESAVADAFCRYQNQKKALSWETAFSGTRSGLVQFSVTGESYRFCPQCTNTFTQITCERNDQRGHLYDPLPIPNWWNQCAGQTYEERFPSTEIVKNCQKMTTDPDGDGLGFEDGEVCAVPPDIENDGIDDTNGDNEANCFLIDFENDPSGQKLGRGTFMSEQYQDWGVSISADSNRYPLSHPKNKAILFDSNNPTGHDYDLMTPTIDQQGRRIDLGKVLIIAQHLKDANNDGKVDDPNDDRKGGEILFTFDRPVTLLSLYFLDADDNSPMKASVYNHEKLIEEFPIQYRGDNSLELLKFTMQPATKLKITLGSGAVDNLRFCMGKKEET